MATAITVLDRLLEIGELFQKDMARAFEGTPLTSARTRVLWELRTSGPSTQHVLARTPRGEPPQHHRSRRRARGRRLRHQIGAPDRPPRHIVSLTASAQHTMREMQREHAELTDDLLGAVEPADRPALERGVDAIAARLRELVAAEEARQADRAEAGA